MILSLRRRRNSFASIALFCLVPVLVAAAGCDTYYIPPPPVTIFINNFTPNLVISSLDSNGNTVPSTLQLQAAVSNSPDTAIIYFVGQDGNYVQGGDATLGFVNGTGVYTAPLAVPNPNTVTIKAEAHVDPTQTSTTTVTLLNPTATSTAVTPSVVTQGLSYTFDVTGSNFVQGATVQLSGAQSGAVQVVSRTELKVTAKIQAAGMLALNVNNPFPFGAPNALSIHSLPSTPATSSAIATAFGRAGTDSSGNPIVAAKAYVPMPDSLAVVNLDANRQFTSVALPSGFVPTMVAANPAQHQVVVASVANPTLQLVDTDRDLVVQSWLAPVAGVTTVDGATCGICGLLVDSARNLAILDTAVGYFTLDLSNGTASAPIAAPAASNFAYDSVTQRIYVPFSGANGNGVDVLDLVAGTVTAVDLGGGNLFGTGAASGTFDPSTELLTVGDKVTGTFLSLNFNNAQAAAGAVQVAATPFAITNGCAGAWKGMDLDFTGHLGWFANLGTCIAAASMPRSAPNGAPGPPTNLRWAQVPLPPDGVAWTNTPLGQPPTIAVATGSNGRAYGLALRGDGGMLLKVDLALLQQANAVAGGADVNQVDPLNVTVNGVQTPALVFISLR